jgi:hypothetical protein
LKIHSAESVRTAWTSGEGPRFRDQGRQMREAVESIGADKATQWIELAQELARSNDEVYFQSKIDGLHKLTEKGGRLLEGIALAVEPIARNLMRLKSVAD